MLLRKSMIQEIGVLDGNYTFIASDSDYSFTARARGWEIWLVSQSAVVHECGASSCCSNPEIERLKLQDIIYFGRKWIAGDLYRHLAFREERNGVAEVNKILTDLSQTLAFLQAGSAISNERFQSL